MRRSASAESRPDVGGPILLEDAAGVLGVGVEGEVEEAWEVEVLLLALALVGVGAITREEKKAKKQLRKAENLQNRARARDSLVRDSAHLGKII